MNKDVYAGQDVIRSFFENIDRIDGVDKKTVNKIKELYQRVGMLTDKNLQNALDELFEEALDEKVEKDGKD